MNEIDKFFDDLPKQDQKVADVFNDKKPEEAPEKEEEVIENKEESPEEGEPRKNRRHRRIEEQLQKEREANIALAERVKILSEVDKFAKDEGIDPRIAKMFDGSDIGKENALRLSEVISDMSAKAKEEALQEIEQREARKQEEQKEYESFIDNELESLEDEYNVDLTSDAPSARKARRELLEMVSDLSPKDENGTITGYADFHSTFQVLQKTRTEQKVDNSRRAEIASKSMQRSGNNSPQRTDVTPGFRGWEKDFGLGQ